MRPHNKSGVLKFLPLTLALALCLLSSVAYGFDCTPWKYSTETPESLSTRASSVWGATQKNTRGLLWQITSNTGGISYLFGTIHLSDSRVIEFSEYVKPYLNRVQNFALEVLITPEVPALLSKKMFFLDGGRLADHLDSGVLAEALELLGRHGLDPYSANRVKPWAAYITLSVPPSDNNVPLDLHLLSRAEARGSKLFGIEEIEEQLAIFEELDTRVQVSLLKEAICNYQENQAQIEVMLTAYLEQDLARLGKLSEQYRTSVNERLLQRLVVERNQLMATRMNPWLEDGGFFIAVGALHLGGETGLLNTLKDRGFLIEVVDADYR